MRVLVVHNRYQEPGGEDSVVRAETEMLRSNGIEVHGIDFTNEIAPKRRTRASAELISRSAWSAHSYHRVTEACLKYRPHIVHIHNFWMQASPAVHHAASDMNVATVQTLHNFRLLCLNAQLMRNDHICEDCVGLIPWRGIVHKCYRGSAPASAAVAAMILLSRIRGTWQFVVDAFIALTSHSRKKFVSGGLPEGRLFVKPNFLNHQAVSSIPPSMFRECLYIGRLSREKGVGGLIAAWAAGRMSQFGTLTIVGDGPERRQLEVLARSLNLSEGEVRFTGFASRQQVADHLSRSRLLVVPSIWYETFGMVILEAAAAGRPSIVYGIGALPEVVQDGKTGLVVPPADSQALAGALRRALTDNNLIDALGEAALRNYLCNYTADQNFGVLMGIYRFAMERKSRELPALLRGFESARTG